MSVRSHDHTASQQRDLLTLLNKSYESLRLTNQFCFRRRGDTSKSAGAAGSAWSFAASTKGVLAPGYALPGLSLHVYDRRAYTSKRIAPDHVHFLCIAMQSNPASPHPGPSPGPYSGPLTSHQCSLLPDGRPAYGPRCLPSQPWTRISRLNEAALGLSPRRAAPIAAPGGSAQAPARAGGPAPAGVGGVAGEHHIARIRSLAGALL